MAVDKELVAFVTGANGITGDYVVRQLGSEPKWTRIIATSRRQPHHLPEDPRVQFTAYDLDIDDHELPTALKTVGAVGVTHFFHLAYIHHDSFEKQYDYNVPFFKNVLAAVDQLNQQSLQRVLLQTGAKHYGFPYKSPPSFPIIEDMGRLGVDGPPNFYYDQEDFMFELQKQNRKWTWTVTRPFLISGFTHRSGQSFSCTAALYFTMQKFLGEPAVFSVPGKGESCYEKRQDFSSAANIAAFTSYAALEQGAENQAFNIVDNDKSAPTCKDIWESMGSYFGIPVATKYDFDVEADIKEKLQRGVWRELVQRHGGDRSAFEKFATLSFFGWIMKYSTWPAHVSMAKAAKEIGWTRQYDTIQDLTQTFDSMKREGVIPDI